MSATDVGPRRIADLLRIAMRQAQAETPADRKAREAAQAAEEAAWRDEYALRRALGWPEHLRACGAPEDVLTTLPPRRLLLTPALLEVDAWLRDGTLRFLVLSGGPGSGKTTAACRAFERAVRREARTGLGLEEWDGTAGAVLRLDELCTWGDFLTPKQQLRIEAVEAVRVLVLEDVHPARPPLREDDAVEPLGQWGQRWLNRLVETRNTAGKRTVITTNLSLRARGGPHTSPFARFVREQNFSRINGSCAVRDCGRRDLRTEATP